MSLPAAFYWIGDDVNGLTETVIFMKSTSNDINDTGSNKVKDKDYYIAVPIRCIKEQPNNKSISHFFFVFLFPMYK